MYTVPATVNALEAPAFAPVLAKPLAGLPFVGLVTVDAEIVSQLATLIIFNCINGNRILLHLYDYWPNIQYALYDILTIGMASPLCGPACDS